MMAILRAVILIAFACSAHTITDLYERDTGGDSPLLINPSNYRVRFWHTTIVVGNYLYIDGGEITYRDETNTTIHVASQSTYSIDISSSWTNDTVSIKATDKTSSIPDADLNIINLWHSLDNSSFYSYNGVKANFPNSGSPPSNKLYRFTVDGVGSGQWSEVDTFYTAGSNFTALKRVGGTVGTCSSDTCYAVGGYRTSRTEADITSGTIPASGIVSYNLTSDTWHNDTLVGTIFAGPWASGVTFFTDIGGNEGMLVLIGGAVTDASFGSAVRLSYENVYLYDIATKTWFQQGTTGDIPSLYRDGFCYVGIRGDNQVNKTYEIFIHGGDSGGRDNLALDDVWVLSLPSFHWHQAGHSPARGRAFHSCQVVGQRQMVLVGGTDPDWNGPDNDMPPDIWKLGLGVFDMSDMVFKDRYNADAPAYTTPRVIQKWYIDNGPIAQNVSDDIKDLFISSNSTKDTPSPVTSSVPSNNSGSNTGAIAGGVVGAVVGIILLVAVVWMLRRRGHRQRSHAQNLRQVREADGHETFEAEGKQTHEAEARERHELL